MVKKDRMRAAMLIGATNATVHLPSTVLGDYKKFVNRALSDHDAMEKMDNECHCLEGKLDWLQSYGPWVTCTATLSYASYKPEMVKLFKTFFPLPLIQDLNKANPSTVEFNSALSGLAQVNRNLNSSSRNRESSLTPSSSWGGLGASLVDSSLRTP